ncbi:MAG: hypothetical protein ACJ77K_08260 [Bacteroidia bacterium]
MNSFLEKYKFFLYSLLADIICVFGVFIFNWNVIIVILFYWLDVVVMILFVGMFMKKLNKAEFSPDMLLGAAMVFGVLYVFYYIMVTAGNEMGYHIDKGFFMAFQPGYMLPVFLLSSSMNNFQEYRLYVSQLADRRNDFYAYPKLWVIRFFSVEVLLVIAAIAAVDELIAILLVIVVKWAILAWQRSKSQSSSSSQPPVA